MIAFHRVGLEYPRTKTKALYNVNLEIKKGEFVYVVGHSGAGKSTLLALILRRLVATQGAVYFAGQNLKHLRGDQVAYHRRRIGMVFQDHRLLSDMTVEENLAFVLQVQGVPRREWPERITTALRRVGLSHKKRAFPEELSVGEAHNPPLAPTTNGGPTSGSEFPICITSCFLEIPSGCWGNRGTQGFANP